MSIRLAFLGTGTCNSTSRNPSSLTLGDGGEVICVDFGGGAYHQLSRLADPHFSYKNITVIFLTHFHADHVSGLPDFLWGEMWDFGGRREVPVTLVGPHGLKNFYQDRLLPFLGDYPIPFEVKLVELGDGETLDGGFYAAKSFHLEHGEFSTGYLFTMGGRTLAVTGDTGYSESLINLLRKSDVAVMEWSLPDYNTYPGHLSTSDIVKLLKTGVLPEKIFITHMYLAPETEFEEQVKRSREILGGEAGRFTFPRDLEIFELE